MVLDVVYFNDDDPANYTTQDVTVTFNCDVADSVNAGAVFTTLSICGSVAPLDWDFAANTNPLADQGDNVWSINVLFPAAHGKASNTSSRATAWTWKHPPSPTIP